MMLFPRLRQLTARWRERASSSNTARSTSRTSGATLPAEIALDGPFTHEWVHTRGIRLHIVQAGRPTDPLIVFLHGALGGWFDYRHVLPTIAASGFHCVAVDMRGFGMSDKPPTGYDIRTLGGDIYGLIQATGHSDAILVGNGTGGAIMWTLACRHPEVVRGLVSVAAAHPSDLRRCLAMKPWQFTTPLLRAASAYLPAHLRHILSSHRVQATVNIHANTAEVFHVTPRAQAEIELREKIYNINNSEMPRAKVIRLELAAVPRRMNGAVRVPTLVLHDATSPWLLLSQRAADRVLSELTCRHIPNTKNLPHLERPEEFAELVLEFASSVRETA